MIKPIGNRILIKPYVDQAKDERLGDVELVKAIPDELTRGIVVEIGTGLEIHAEPIEVGDVVILEKYQGEEVMIEGNMHKFIKLAEILGVDRQ